MVEPKKQDVSDLPFDERLLEGFLRQESSEPSSSYHLSSPSVSAVPSFEHLKDVYTSSSMDSLLHSLNDHKMMNTREVIADIESLIEERKELQQEVFRDVDKIMMQMNNFLVAAGEKIETTKEAELREKLLDIEAFKLNEKINAFRDIAALKKELRDRMHEYREQEQNAHMIDELLQDS